MTFRSDDDALRAKNEVLQEDLAEARRELAEARPRIERVEALEQELSDARKELLELRSPRHGRGGSALAAVAGTLVAVVFVAGGVLFALRSSQHEAEAELAAVAARRVQLEQEARWEAEQARRRAEQARAAARASDAFDEIPFAEGGDRPAPEPYAELAGRVTSVEGPAPAVEGGECQITVERAHGSGFDARLHVECGGRTVYGREGVGYLECDMRDGRPERCEDRGGSRENGDPMVVLDLPTRTVVVSDGPELPWTARVAIDAPDGEAEGS